MRTMCSLKMVIALFVTMLMVGCNTDDPTLAKKSPIVELTAGEATATTLTLIVETENVEQAAYVCLDADEVLPGAEDIVATGVAVEVNSSVEISIKDLAPESEYIVVAAAMADGEYVRSEAVSMSTTALPLDAPAVSIVAGDVTPQSLGFTVVSSNADEVFYLCVEAAGDEPSAESIVTSGISVEPNVEADVVVEELKSATDYKIYAAAKNNQYTTLAEAVVMTTAEFAEPKVEASLTEDVGADYFTFSVSATDFEDLRYIAFVRGERDVTDEQAYKNGKSIELTDESVTVKVDGLKDDTEYELRVVAKNGDKYAGEVLYAKTSKAVVVYDVVPESVTATIGSYKDNFFLTFNDTQNDLQLKLDLYTSEPYDYLPSGEYRLESESADYYFGTTYTALLVSGSEFKPFADGVITVDATPNEETREVNYKIAVALVSAEGDYEAYMTYEGMIEGLELPVVVPDVPEGAYVFIPVESRTERKAVNDEEAGEYYIKFVDEQWNELVLDIRVDPAICNDGKDALPAGKYVLNNGINETYSYLSLYNPYFSGNFTVANLTVECDEDLVYTFSLLAIAKSGTTEKVVYMHWTGLIDEMVRE